MASGLSDNFYLNAPKPIDRRGQFDTIEDMKNYKEFYIDDGRISYCKEDEKLYQFKSSNSVDEITGRWRELSAGGGDSSPYSGLPLTTETLGGVKEKSDINGLTVQEVVKNMLITYQPPEVKFDIAPKTLLYEYNDAIRSLQYTINVTKISKPVTSLTIKHNGEIIHTFLDDEKEGIFYFTDQNHVLRNTTEITVEASDGTLSGVASKTIVFAHRYYCGYANANQTINASFVKTLPNKLIASNNNKWENITCDDKKLVIAYATEYGDLKQICDGNGFNYLSTYEKQVMDIDGVSYNVYIKKSPITLNSYELNFA